MRPSIEKIILRLSSLRLTFIVMLVLAATVLGTYKNPSVSVSWVVIPLILLALNLLAAIITNNKFRNQYGLLSFHLGLLGIILLAALGIMTSMDARLEITEGQIFNPSDVDIMYQGPLHMYHLDQINFMQGDIKVKFVSSMRRSNTQSEIWKPDEKGTLQSTIIGDGQTLKSSGYRFLTTGNKGYSVILTWIDDEGFTTSGTINMPSYPMYEWKQANEWITPHGQHLLLSLKISNNRNNSDNAWELNSKNIDAQIMVKTSEIQQVLSKGGKIKLPNGSLKFEDIRIWMGYRIDYNPMLIWQFISALIAITGLIFHFLKQFYSYPLKHKISTQQNDMEHSLNV